MTSSNDHEEKAGALARLLDHFVLGDPIGLQSYVDKLREQNPELSCDEIAQKIVRRKSFKNGLVGAALGLGGVITLPVTIPADVVASWKIQITMALAVAYAYGHTHKTTDLRTDVYIILAGEGAKEALKRLGIELSKGVTHKAIQKYVTREVMKKIWKVIPQRIVTREGGKSLFKIAKGVPLVGAPIGFAFDWMAARAVGHYAIKYYSGRG